MFIGVERRLSRLEPILKVFTLLRGYVADLPIALAAIDPCMSCTDRIAIIDIGKRKRWVGSTDQLRRHIKKCHGK